VIHLRTSTEMDTIAEAGGIIGRLHAELETVVRPGVSTAERGRFAEGILAAHAAAAPTSKGL